MSDQTTFEREVDEEVRQDEMLRLWKAYGPYLVGAMVAGVALMGAYQLYGWWQHGRLTSASDKFEAALKVADNASAEEAAVAFEALSSAPGGYAVLAQFVQAAALAGAGDVEGALAIYDRMASDGSIDRLYSSLAGLKAAYLMGDRQSPEELLVRIEPQMTANNPWLPFLRDLKGLAHIRAGQLREAHDAYRLLAADLTAPEGLRNRATQMQEFLAGALAVADTSGAADTVPESGASTTGGDNQ